MRSTPYSLDRLTRFFAPRSIAIVGATERTLYTQLSIASAERFSSARLLLVNRRGTPVLGRNAATSCVALGEQVDTAFVQVPASAAMDAIEDAYAAGIRNVVLLSSGFAENNEAGRQAQLRLTARADELGMLVLGPNHLGFINLVDNVSASAMVPLPTASVGALALIAQSGSVALGLSAYAAAQGVGLSHQVTVGNEAMLTAADVIGYAIEDERVNAVALYLESIAKPDRFAAVARRAAELGKPVIVYKSGASAISARAAVAHTGAFVGDDKTVNAVLKDLDVIRVHSLEDLISTGKLATGLGRFSTKGVGVVTNSGGINGVIADLADRSDVTLVELAAETVAAIDEAIPDEFVTAQNPFDMTGASVRDPQIWDTAITLLAKDPAIDVLVVGLDLRGAESMNQIIATALRSCGKPYICASFLAEDMPVESQRTAQRLGLNLVSTSGLEPTMRGLGAIGRWQAHKDRLAADLPWRAAPVAVPSVDARQGNWSEHCTRCMLESADIPVVAATLVHTPDEAVATARAYGQAVAVKIVSPDILHKTDIGGVALGVDGDEAVRAAFERVLAAGHAQASARIEGVLLSPMRPPGIELLVGAVRDAQWGLVLVIALGGTLVEILDDSVIVPLPFTPQRVGRALSSLRGAALFKGARGAPPVDLAQVAHTITRFGDLASALGDPLESLEINPLRITGSTIEALDAVVTWRTV
ncbi:acetate--CoA ligase family protein [Variovorax sp. RHLX14]|uniref:acetate--CoA ligase family protein n=1 Tax=Variovorax sp. RHLX14 TaxID=1259731 RepID=UPI003F44828D